MYVPVYAQITEVTRKTSSDHQKKPKLLHLDSCTVAPHVIWNNSDPQVTYAEQEDVIGNS